MKDKGRIYLMICLMLFVLIGLPKGLKAQEGVLHRLARAVYAIPMAVLKSLQGPTPAYEDRFDGGDQPPVRYPYGTQRLSGQVYDYNPEGQDPMSQSPRYVTYKIVVPQHRYMQEQDKANIHVYSSIPFDNR